MKKNKTKVGNGRGDRAQHDWAKMSAGGGGIHLDEADRRQRQKASAMHAIRQMIKGHRHLFGEEITDVKHLFHAIDTDRGGTIERGEWDAALTRLGLGLSPMQLSELWAGLDADGNGVIDYSELASEISPKHSRRRGRKKNRSGRAVSGGLGDSGLPFPEEQMAETALPPPPPPVHEQTAEETAAELESRNKYWRRMCAIAQQTL